MAPPTEEQSTGQQPSEQRTVERVSVRIPPFWPDRPALWFAQLEGQFHLSGITTDKTKFRYAVSNLDGNHAQEVEDIITSPPAEGAYERVKSELISRLSASREAQIRRLLEHEEIGDKKPSQFLRHLRNLAGATFPDDFLRTLWLGRLPTAMQTVLASQASMDLTGLGNLADTINEIVPRSLVASASTTSDVSALTAQVAELAKQVAALTTKKGKQRPRGRSQSRQRTTPTNSTDREKFCWYHDRFGDNAKKCTPPCSFSSGNGRGSRQ